MWSLVVASLGKPPCPALPWLPKCSLSFGLFRSTSTSQTLPLNKEVSLLSALPLLALPSHLHSYRSSSQCPCCSSTSKNSPRAESCRLSFQGRGSMPFHPSGSADAPGPLSTDCWIRHLCVLLSRVAVILCKHLHLNPPV